MTVRPGYRSLFLLIDPQVDFCPGGALAVPDGDAIVAPVDRIVAWFAEAGAPIGVTQDWHPAGHLSFASAHPDKSPFEETDLAYGRQILWPDHCVQGTPGAAFLPGLELDRAEFILRKGFRPSIDSYSAFFENDRETSTGLGGYLTERGIDHLWMAGLATEICVAYSAFDARRLGFEVTLALPACRGLGDVAPTLERLREAGVTLLETLPG